MSELQLYYVSTLTDLEATRVTVDQLGYIFKTQVDQLGYNRVDEMFIDQVG